MGDPKHGCIGTVGKVLSIPREQPASRIFFTVEKLNIADASDPGHRKDSCFFCGYGYLEVQVLVLRIRSNVNAGVFEDVKKGIAVGYNVGGRVL
jgi:hypothetical protein